MCRTLGDKRGFLRVPHSFASFAKGWAHHEVEQRRMFPDPSPTKNKGRPKAALVFPEG